MKDLILERLPLIGGGAIQMVQLQQLWHWIGRFDVGIRIHKVSMMEEEFYSYSYSD